MIFGTFWELLALWFIACVVGSFLGAFRIIAIINIGILMLIVVGFFIGIGIHVFNLVI